MLTKDKLDRILNFPQSQEELLIKAVHENKGAVHIDNLNHINTNMNNCIVIRKSAYLDKKGKTVTLVRRGKGSERVYSDPSKADNVHNFVFSLLYKDFNQSFKSSLHNVIAFCEVKGINSIGYQRNSNIFDTYKKEVKKLLTSEGKI